MQKINDNTYRITIYSKEQIVKIYLSESEFIHMNNHVNKFNLDQSPECLVEFVSHDMVTNIRTTKSIEFGKEMINRILLDYHNPLPF